MNTGTGQFGLSEPGCVGHLWVGRECDNCPGFVVLQSGPRGLTAVCANVVDRSGMLPTYLSGLFRFRKSNATSILKSVRHPSRSRIALNSD